MPARAPITFSFDLEDHRPDEDAELRFPQVTREVLAFLRRNGVAGTIFVVGEVAEAHPDLVREAAQDGHEIGLHGWVHKPLAELGPDTFRRHVRRGADVVGEITGRPVSGFRSPTYSLTRESVWASEVLAQEGFTYSSSILPAHNPLFGFPGAPREPFRWPSGLAELPVPVAGLGNVAIPFLGGVYLRVLPWPAVSAAHRLGSGGTTPWTYCHPYDFDPGEVPWVVPDSGRLGSKLLWLNRKLMFRRMEQLFALGVGAPLRDRIPADLPTWVPDGAAAAA